MSFISEMVSEPKYDKQLAPSSPSSNVVSGQEARHYRGPAGFTQALKQVNLHGRKRGHDNPKLSETQNANTTPSGSQMVTLFVGQIQLGLRITAAMKIIRIFVNDPHI